MTTTGGAGGRGVLLAEEDLANNKIHDRTFDWIYRIAFLIHYRYVSKHNTRAEDLSRIASGDSLRLEAHLSLDCWTDCCCGKQDKISTPVLIVLCVVLCVLCCVCVCACVSLETSRAPSSHPKSRLQFSPIAARAASCGYSPGKLH